MRVELARATLERVQWGSKAQPAIAFSVPSLAEPSRANQLLRRFLKNHGWFIALVLLVVAGEISGHGSAWLTVAEPGLEDHTAASRLARRAPDSAGQMIAASPAIDQVRQFALTASIAEPLAPASSTPREPTEIYGEVHLLGEGETLGDLALRYGVSLASIVWSNHLERGDALMLGQPLRIPRISGAPHTVAGGEDVEAVAARFGVPPEAIRAFSPNRLYDGRALLAGEEIFVPGGEPPLPEALLARGGIVMLAALKAEAAGVVLGDETNLREGPGTDYGRVVQLAGGRQVALRARHGSWLKVEIAGVAGWIRADLLQIADGLIDTLPETDDFPPPPPRWVWPAWGTLTSSYGARWGGFHNGIDIANRAWTPIVAARAGRVTEAGWCSGYGYCVKISHDGGIETIYGHLIAKPSVVAGDEVSAGQRIGSMGSTYDRAGGGYSTGVHLHFTVLINGRAVNPMAVLP